jgi:hypothetical protein
MLHRQGELIERIILVLIARQSLSQQSLDEATSGPPRHPALQPTRQFVRQADKELLGCH